MSPDKIGSSFLFGSRLSPEKSQRMPGFDNFLGVNQKGNSEETKKQFQKIEIKDKKKPKILLRSKKLKPMFSDISEINSTTLLQYFTFPFKRYSINKIPFPHSIISNVYPIVNTYSSQESALSAKFKAESRNKPTSLEKKRKNNNITNFNHRPSRDLYK